MPRRHKSRERDSSGSRASIFVRVEDFYWNVLLQDICYIEARRNYCMLVTTGKRQLVFAAIGKFEEVLPAKQFCRVHRGYIVRIDNVTHFDHHRLWIGKEELPISETCLKSLLAMAPVVGDSKMIRKKGK